ncbi:MAG: nucleotidyl transferase AbiEii/AbiGii toxin family protein [Candidatus Woesearchaeota archaeon]|jgi:predicted nucleotidyltransferase component of viral defense system|nr:nucleotidyl transferase AbiEii/AbiGii toxin family protein [Candidatus Woesearchaeota archaeon]MDP7457604.1 nucleotidyl transferase AbiEii/AbiGii toxin family protein [Candidatus Woesearchaeota archaeon]|tara:strand:- start:17 stop:805 length:789 start_codon:yes stop_codon:yes gene_type:complete
MDEIKNMTREDMQDLVKKTNFDERFLTKDYYITRLLFDLKDIKNAFFKGGTALQKTLLEHARLSEDIDFTVTKNIYQVEQEIRSILYTEEFITKVEKDKSVHQFVRLVIHYDNFRGRDDTIFIDLNERAKLALDTETSKINHLYPEFIPSFSFPTLCKEEMIAEKMAATIGRNKPRDHFDLYTLIQKGFPINLDLVKKKCKQSGNELTIINMFNKAKKLKNRWDEDMGSLLPEEVSFQEVMKKLAHHFHLKKEKDKLKNKKE